MSHHETNPDCSQCADLDAAIQALLDGDSTPLPAALEEHRDACARCQANYRATVELARALPRLPRAKVPAGFADRVANAVVADRAITPSPTRTIRRALAWLAIAACVAAMVGVVRPWSADGPLLKLVASRPAKGPESKPEQPAPPAEAVPLRDSWDAATSALASLTRRTADQTIEPTRKLLPEQIEAPTMVSADQLPHALDPAAQSLQEIRHGAAVGFEPVANSARRAVSMFLRESPDAERKGGL